MSSPITDYFEEYRQKRKELSEIDNEIKDLRSKMDSLRDRSSLISKELSGMRRIITVMVETGMDPVEAKLKNEISNLSESLWDDVILADSMSDTTSLATITLSPTSVSWMSSIGATGSVTNTGAVGQHQYSGQKRVIGAVGSGGGAI